MITDFGVQPPHQKHTAFPPTLPPEYSKRKKSDAALQVTLSLMLSYPLGHRLVPFPTRLYAIS